MWTLIGQAEELVDRYDQVQEGFEDAINKWVENGGHTDSERKGLMDKCVRCKGEPQGKGG